MSSGAAPRPALYLSNIRASDRPDHMLVGASGLCILPERQWAWAATLSGFMSRNPKLPDVLDGMVEHVRYEVEEVVDFLRWTNGWCSVLHPELAKLTSQSMLEA